MPGLQDLVNRWVNTNKAHYVFSDEAEQKLAAASETALSKSYLEGYHKSGRLRNTHKHSFGSQLANYHKDEWTVSSVATPATVATGSTGMSSLTDEGKRTSSGKKAEDRKLTTGKNSHGRLKFGKGLHRTNSHSDLLKQRFEEELQIELQQHGEGKQGKGGNRWRKSHTPDAPKDNGSNKSEGHVKRGDEYCRNVEIDKNTIDKCSGCEQKKKHLDLIMAELKFLRSNSFLDDGTCFACQRNMSHENFFSLSNCDEQKNSVCQSITGDGKKSFDLSEVSEHLHNVTCRQNNQIEQMTKERAICQNQYHDEIEKLRILFDKLSEECRSHKLNAEVANTKFQCFRTEHDLRTFELIKLKDQVSHMHRIRHENGVLREKLRKQDIDMMNHHDEAIRQRDKIIVELSTRLQIAMKTLKAERQKNRKRRIIFPSSKQSTEKSLIEVIGDLRDEICRIKEEKKEIENKLMLLESC